MKKLALYTLSFFLCTFTFAQQFGWKDISANIPMAGSLSDVMFIGQEGWITGPDDAVFYTPDGGETFVIQNLPEMPGSYGITSSIFMINSEKGYVVTYSGEINKTDDGGNTWTQLYDPGGIFYRSLHCPPNSDTCYVCGDSGKVWKFTDNFIVEFSPEGVVSAMSCIVFPESNAYGVICGEAIIRRYFNNTWNNLIFYDSSTWWNSIFCLDNQNCCAVGLGGAIAVTQDGEQWLPQNPVNYKELYAVYFVSPTEGWAAGTEVLTHTTDGGITWTEITQIDLEGVILTALWFNSEHEGYAVGNNGMLLKYTDLSDVPEFSKENEILIFPNPAIDKFKVQCSKSKVEGALLELFDLNGSKLLEKHFSKGSETMEVDVNGLQDGLYFVQLQFENQCVTKKIIIQK